MKESEVSKEFNSGGPKMKSSKVTSTKNPVLFDFTLPRLPIRFLEWNPNANVTPLKFVPYFVCQDVKIF